MPLTRIALIGATSRIGPAILNSLSHASPPLAITIILRPTSKPVPAYLHTSTLTLPSDPPTPSHLTAALVGHDALVCALHPRMIDLQLRLADACITAGVRRYVLADYGSVQSDDPLVEALVPLFRNKTRVREYCQQLVAEYGIGCSSWTSLVTGHFFDYGLAERLLGFDLRGGRVRLFDGGTGKWSASTVGQIGRAVVGVLRPRENGDEDETAGKVLYVQSFCVSQVEVLAAVNAVRRGEGLKVEEVGSEEYIRRMKEEMEGGDYESLEQIVCVLGLTRARWDEKEDFANVLLGLEEEDLGEVVREVCESVWASSS